MSTEINQIVKEISELKQSSKNIETRLLLMEKVLNQLFELINNITIFIDDAQDIGDLDDEEEEDWTPYDERNFSYDDNDEEDIGGDDYWSSKEDES